MSHAFRPLLLSTVLAASLTGCRIATAVVPLDEPSDVAIPVALPTELSFTPVLAQAPLRDTARIAGVPGRVAVLGLLNQTAPCFGLSSAATRTGDRIVIRLLAKEVSGTCNTFAAGAFDYDVGASTGAPGTYDVDVVHRIELNTGRVVETKVGGKRVEVK